MPARSAGASDAAARPQCLASNECPTGYVCNDFGVCVATAATARRRRHTTAAARDRVRVRRADRVASRFVYVAMTEQDSLARIDGRNLEVRSTGVGKAPRVVATIPHEDGAVVLDSFNGTATIVRPPMVSTSIRITVKVLATLLRS